MKKLKKCIIASIALLICIILCCSTATAKEEEKEKVYFDKDNIDEYKIGQTLHINEERFYRDELYCVEHMQRLPKEWTPYKLVSKLKIIGNESTDYKGKTIKNYNNAVLVGILTGTEKSNRVPMRNAIWNFMKTWVEKVGEHHSGITLSFASSTPGDPNLSADLMAQAHAYADSLKEISEKLTDNTDKKKIKIKEIKVDNKSYTSIGPFKYTFSGELIRISPKDQNGKVIKNALIGQYEGKKMTWKKPKDIKSGKEFYIVIPNDGQTSKITTIVVTARKGTRRADIWFFKSLEGSAQNFIYFDPKKEYEDLEGSAQNFIYFDPKKEYEDERVSFEYDIPIEGSLKVIKVDKDNNEVKLKGVGFYIKNNSMNKYVKQNSDKTVSYVDKKEEATEFITDAKGEILIKNLIIGTYTAYETKNPNQGYEILKDGVEKTVVVDKTTDFVIENKQVYVNLSGYVWEDKIFGKQSLRNDLFKDNDYDSEDDLIAGIKVRLKDKTGKIIAEKETKAENAYKYRFTKIRIDQLENYHIEFEYDGIIYTNVVPHIEKDNGSKAIENIGIREQFNNGFSTIEGNGDNTGYTLDENGNKKHDLSYEKDTEKHTSTFISNGKYPITANTNDAKYVIKDHYKPGIIEIENINLGLYRREQPDLALIKDLDNVKLTINGYEHIYEYAQRFKNQGEYGDGFNVGVKFGNKYGEMKYTRPIYKSDYEYVNEKDKNLIMNM